MTKLFGNWNRIPALANGISGRFQRSVQQALLQEAHRLRGLIVKGIASGAPAGKPFAPLSPLTIALRKATGFGGTKPLNRTGALRGSVVVKRTGDAVFIGILRQAKAKSGQSLVNIGEIHEFGRSWQRKPLTAKQRRFLFAVLGRGGVSRGASRGPGGAVTITIPARPFMAPVFEQEAPGIVKRFWQRVAKGMGGDFAMR